MTRARLFLSLLGSLLLAACDLTPVTPDGPPAAVTSLSGTVHVGTLTSGNAHPDHVDADAAFRPLVLRVGETGPEARTTIRADLSFTAPLPTPRAEDLSEFTLLAYDACTGIKDLTPGTRVAPLHFAAELHPGTDTLLDTLLPAAETASPTEMTNEAVTVHYFDRAGRYHVNADCGAPDGTYALKVDIDVPFQAGWNVVETHMTVTSAGDGTGRGTVTMRPTTKRPALRAVMRPHED